MRRFTSPTPRPRVQQSRVSLANPPARPHPFPRSTLASAPRCHLQTAKAAEPESDDGDDIAAQVGVGTVAEDAELDALAERIEKEIMAPDGALGRYRGLVSRLCRSDAVRAGPEFLKSAALLAMCKMMVLDADFCEEDNNLGAVFGALCRRVVGPDIRKTLVVSVGDLAFRHPNVLEPWTSQMYEPLR